MTCGPFLAAFYVFPAAIVVLKTRLLQPFSILAANGRARPARSGAGAFLKKSGACLRTRFQNEALRGERI
jgi:hypothetical protein